MRDLPSWLLVIGFILLLLIFLTVAGVINFN